MKILIHLILLALPIVVVAQDNPDCYAEKDFLIISSTPEYGIAYKFAIRAAEELDLHVNLRNLIPVDNKDIGLSLPADSCLLYTAEFGEPTSHCYVARGRGDDGVYVSIEYSNAYSAFSKGYYIVVVGSGAKEDEVLSTTLQWVRGKYSDAYIKSSKVYMCCMH